MNAFKEILPPVEVALNLEPEEFALPLLEFLCFCEDNREWRQSLHPSNISLRSEAFIQYCDPKDQEAMSRVIAEAWVWLERECLIAPNPKQEGHWIFVTRRGRKFRKIGNVKNFKSATFLPQEMLDPQLASKITSLFLRGDYELAVFAAFREVEICVRGLGEFEKGDIGTDLMRKAFKPQTGSLIDTAQLPGEQQGISDLFSGAIASFKNPGSHRAVDFDDPAEAAKLIMFADLLIRIAKQRKSSDG